MYIDSSNAISSSIYVERSVAKVILTTINMVICCEMCNWISFSLLNDEEGNLFTEGNLSEFEDPWESYPSVDESSNEHNEDCSENETEKR